MDHFKSPDEVFICVMELVRIQDGKRGRGDRARRSELIFKSFF